MTKQELGMFEDNPRSQAGAEALEELEAQLPVITSVTRDNVILGEKWGLEPDLDPRVVATQAAERYERTFEAYRQGGAWTMKAGVEYSPREH